MHTSMTKTLIFNGIFEQAVEKNKAQARKKPGTRYETVFNTVKVLLAKIKAISAPQKC